MSFGKPDNYLPWPGTWRERRGDGKPTPHYEYVTIGQTGIELVHAWVMPSTTGYGWYWIRLSSDGPTRESGRTYERIELAKRAAAWDWGFER